MKLTRFLALPLALSLASAASAVVVVNDGFEYQNQAAFEAVWPAIGTAAPLSGALTAAQAASGAQSISNPGTATNAQSRNQLTFAPTPLLTTGGAQLVWSFDFRETSTTGNPQRNFANLQSVAAPGTTPAGQLISMGVNNNQLAADSGGNYFMARILGFAHSAVDPEGGPNESAGGTGSGAYFKMNDSATAGLRGATPAWHNLKVVLTTNNGTTVNHAYYVDGVLAETVLGASANLQYTVIRLGSGLSNGGIGAFYDNMRLEYIAAVPEASSFLAVGLVGLVLGGAKWFRRKAA